MTEVNRGPMDDVLDKIQRTVSDHYLGDVKPSTTAEEHRERNEAYCAVMARIMAVLMAETVDAQVAMDVRKFEAALRKEVLGQLSDRLRPGGAISKHL